MHLPRSFTFADDPSHLKAEEALRFLEFIRKRQITNPDDVFEFKRRLDAKGNVLLPLDTSDEEDAVVQKKRRRSKSKMQARQRAEAAQHRKAQASDVDEDEQAEEEEASGAAKYGTNHHPHKEDGPEVEGPESGRGGRDAEPMLAERQTVFSQEDDESRIEWSESDQEGREPEGTMPKRPTDTAEADETLGYMAKMHGKGARAQTPGWNAKRQAASSYQQDGPGPGMETAKSPTPTRNDKGHGIEQTINRGKEKQKVKEGERHEPNPTPAIRKTTDRPTLLDRSTQNKDQARPSTDHAVDLNRKDEAGRSRSAHLSLGDY